MQLSQQDRTRDPRLQGLTRREFSWRSKPTTTKIRENSGTNTNYKQSNEANTTSIAPSTGGNEYGNHAENMQDSSGNELIITVNHNMDDLLTEE